MKIPSYIYSFATIIKENKHIICLSIRCSCGCNLFLLQSNCVQCSADKQKKRMAGDIRLNAGDAEADHQKTLTHIICARCADCGKIIVLFDNRLHGYNALVGGLKTDGEKEPLPFFDAVPHQIELKIINDLTYEEFVDDWEMDVPEDTYSNAFSYIAISYVEGAHKTLVFEEETD